MQETDTKRTIRIPKNSILQANLYIFLPTRMKMLECVTSHRNFPKSSTLRLILSVVMYNCMFAVEAAMTKLSIQFINNNKRCSVT